MKLLTTILAASVIGGAMLVVALVLLIAVQLFERGLEKKFGGDPL